MITTIALIRLIPYLFVGYLAYNKGYPRLTIIASWLILVAVLNYKFALGADVRAIMSSVTALLLLWHVSDLHNRKVSK